MNPSKRMLRLLRLLLPALLAGCVASTAPGYSPEAKSGGVTITFVRHAETVANATSVYRSDTINRFTKDGQLQVTRLTRALSPADFDVVISSPIPRSRNTIRPYLESKGITARIWPELAECCYQKRRDGDIAKSKSIRLDKSGGSVSLNASEKRYFTFASPADQTLYDVDGYVDGLALVDKLCARIRKEFAGSGKNILVVGHSLNGSRMLETLTGKPPQGKIRVRNAAPTVLRETTSGRFKIESLNTIPR